MALQQDSSAVNWLVPMQRHGVITIGTRHVKCSRPMAMSMEQGCEPTNTIGIEDYMPGLIQFASAIEPGSAQVLRALAMSGTL